MKYIKLQGLYGKIDEKDEEILPVERRDQNALHTGSSISAST
jgi:hypothetical protein